LLQNVKESLPPTRQVTCAGAETAFITHVSEWLLIAKGVSSKKAVQVVSKEFSGNLISREKKKL